MRQLVHGSPLARGSGESCPRSYRGHNPLLRTEIGGPCRRRARPMATRGLIPGGVSCTVQYTHLGIRAGAPPESGATAGETEGLLPMTATPGTDLDSPQAPVEGEEFGPNRRVRGA